MTRRYYRHCNCRKRMRRFTQDETRSFYYCACGYRCTIHVEINGLSHGWPHDVTAAAALAHDSWRSERTTP